MVDSHMQKTTLYLTEAIQYELKEAARRTGRSEAEIVREALSTYLAAQVRPLPASIGVGQDKDLAARDFPRIRKLVERYADLPLGYADAAVVACAERSGRRVLTLDRRDFGVVSGEGSITILPA